MQSPTGIIPEELMHYQKRTEVLRFLQSLAIDGDSKVALFQGWCSWCATYITPKDRRTLMQSGI